MTASVVIVVACALALGGWAAVRAARDQPVILRQLYGAGVVELALAAQAAVAVVGLASGHVLAEPWTFWGYLVTALVILPAAALWAFVDRTRWSSLVLLVGALTIAVMQARVLQVWGAVPTS